MKNILGLTVVLILTACGTQESREVKVNRKEVKIVNGDTTINSTTEFKKLTAEEIEQENKETKVIITGPKEFDSLRKISNAQLIDVRTKSEFADGHIEGAQNLDILNGDFNKGVNALNKSEVVLVYCKSGGRSSRARKQLEELGFEYIVELEGGYMNYSK